jgi:proteasome lid subunit RPN8/RPN11
VLTITEPVFLALVAHALRGLPEEACGLVAGPAGSAHASAFYPCRNLANSSKLYTIDPKDHLRADRDAEDRGLEILGVVHSHTHTDAYPSPTDVNQAPDPNWHYLIVSTKYGDPSLRSFRIVDGNISEEPVVQSGQ